ncbi:diguanylate cyclase [Pseudomonas putida]|uniref:Diguanylate cyclase n=1 Tax=Pseudomonas putida TaxID=303 RepID=A0A1Y3KI67_PSEPU|nr:diguanylate cyclase [Pseudomonas putida]
MGAGLPANTGVAGAIHRVGFFAGKPAPTPCASCFKFEHKLSKPACR